MRRQLGCLGPVRAALQRTAQAAQPQQLQERSCCRRWNQKHQRQHPTRLQAWEAQLALHQASAAQHFLELATAVPAAALRARAAWHSSSALQVAAAQTAAALASHRVSQEQHQWLVQPVLLMQRQQLRRESLTAALAPLELQARQQRQEEQQLRRLQVAAAAVHRVGPVEKLIRC